MTKEIPKLRDKIQSVHLCFTTDPFMYGYDEISDMSIKIIQKLNDNGIKCSVLTKGILPIELARLSPDNEYGITLVSLDNDFRNRFEPNSATFQERIQALRNLHDEGCYTWVSIEPYPTPNIIAQKIDDILDEVGFVDKIIFGRMHYNKEISEYKAHKAFFNTCANQVIQYCKAHNKTYIIKKGTITES